ncbi:hypothetical protein JIN85_03500 [Luteolibacter pohnpeiensis]|uniref:SH3 domain-containing protein n=1 Tax=Luteolibacter pohnpeiensis TaxID=454153 RepID=A0A934VUT3_9BACT|nr:hypothetical protein [Luteolibacter pohnpeiensis]MBK1881465.1 hypothetical protein [Luteolibacter pohnpeiensis]
MKLFPVLSASAALCLSACDSLNAPINSSGFDPLAPPGGNFSQNTTTAPTSSFKAGQFVNAAMDNTVFFKSRPDGNAEADKLLTKGTRMKVVSSDASYIKAELDSGEVGYVPAVMVTDPNALPDPNQTLDNPGIYQVYPPPNGAVDPNANVPAFDESNLPPDGAIPTIIDPETPAAPATPPAVTTPPTTTSEPVPLPPGIDDEPKEGE